MEHQGRLVADLEAMSDDPDFEYLIVDSIIVRAHRNAAGAKKGSEDQALGRSRVMPHCYTARINATP
jgi:hypothetical protein